MPTAFVTYSILDAKGARSTAVINFPLNTDIGVLQTFARTTGGMIDALIKGQVVGVGVGIEVDLATVTGIKTAPVDDADVEEGARFTFQSADGYLASMRLPSFDETFMVAGTALVDTAVTAVSNFVARIISGQTVGLTNVSPSTAHEEDLTALVSAVEAFQSSRR